MPEFIEQFSTYYGFIIFRILVFLLVLTGLWLSGKYALIPLLDGFLSRRDMDKHTRKPLLTLTRFFVFIVGAGIAFGVAGFNNFFSSLVTIGAAGTLAIGFALQSLLGNLASGVFIFLEPSFRIGDWIEWDGYEGVVTDIQLRVTRVETFDNEMLTVPNSILTSNVVKNPVANDTLRVRFNFNIDYEEDIGQATEIILEEAKKLNDILDDPGPSVRLTELDDSHITLQSRFWIENPQRTDYVKTRSEYARVVKERFNEEGIKIPFPQRDLSGEMVLTDSDSEPAEEPSDS